MAKSETVLIGTAAPLPDVLHQIEHLLSTSLERERDWWVGTVDGTAIAVEPDDIWDGYSYAVEVYGHSQDEAERNAVKVHRRLREATGWRLAVTLGDVPNEDPVIGPPSQRSA